MIDPLISKRLEELFDQALDLEGEARAAFVAEVDATLRPALLELLAAAEAPHRVDEDPASLAGKLLFENAAIRAGQQLGPYSLLRMLGEGGMASVWLAERNDGQFEQQVAIKCLKTGLGTPEIRARFIQEQKILAKLQHPHIARMYDAGLSSDGVPFIIMEWVKEGLSFTRYCNQHCLSLSRRLALFNKICQAVSYAHQNLIVHRDLKPGNILVGEDGEPKLLDFGIAKLLREEKDVTRTGLRLLTPEYAAPEQYQGDQITTVTDVYALGVILYELLCGLRPQAFDKNRQDTTTLNPSEALRKLSKTTKQSKPHDPKELAEQRATSIEHLQRSLKGDLDIIVMQALQQEPSRRYPSVAALADDLKRYLAKQPITARKDTWSYRTRKFLRRNAYAVAIASITFCLLLFATLFSIQQAKHAQQQTELAKLEASRAKIEAQRATAVKRFLTDLLEVSDAGIPRDQLPSTETLLQDGAKRIQQEFNDTPELKLDLLLLLGRVHTNLGMYQQAEPLLKQALDLANQKLDPSNENWLAAQTAWTELRQQKEGDISDLMPAIARHRRANAKDNPTLAGALVLRGDQYRHLEDVKRGIAMIREGLQMYKRLYGEEHALVLATQQTLSFALTSDRQLVEAENLSRKNLALGKKLHGEKHIGYARDLKALVNVLTNKGDFAEAEDLARKAVSIYEGIYDKPNSQTVGALYALAYILLWKGKQEESLAVAKKAIGYQLRMGNDRSGNLAELSTFQASVAGSLGRYQEAEEAIQQSISAARKNYGPQSTILAESLRVFGDILIDQARYNEAERVLKEALAILRAAPRNGITASKTGYTLNGLAIVRLAGGKAEEALTYCDQALAIMTAYPGISPYFTLSVEITQGAALNALGRFKQANSVLGPVFSDEKQSAHIKGTDAVLFAYGLKELGKTQLGIGDGVGAVKSWQKALSISPGKTASSKQTIAELKRLLAMQAPRES